MTYAALKQADYSIDWQSYIMPHSVCGAEITALSEWLKNVMS